MTSTVATQTPEVLPAERPQAASIVRAAPGDVTEAFGEYRKIQQALDASMPDCLMEIRGKKFRKKNYWRAIATAFSLTLEVVTEERGNGEDGDWGWLVTYRATAPNSRSAVGDGACFASEKGRGQDSIHNVRSHAHTRAFNRAVSNLVGFGEVSAEEMPREPTARRANPQPAQNGGPAFDQPMGFGKKFAKTTWRQMTEGEIGGDRHTYLEWMVANLEDKPEIRERAQKCLQIISNRIDAQVANPEADAHEAPPQTDEDFAG